MKKVGRKIILIIGGILCSPLIIPGFIFCYAGYCVSEFLDWLIE